MRPPGARAIFWLPLIALLGSAPAASQLEWNSYPALLSPCETTVVDAG